MTRTLTVQEPIPAGWGVIEHPFTGEQFPIKQGTVEVEDPEAAEILIEHLTGITQ